MMFSRHKTYKVYMIDQPHYCYYVVAPSKRVARWCAAALFNEEYAASYVTAKRFRAERYYYMP